MLDVLLLGFVPVVVVVNSIVVDFCCCCCWCLYITIIKYLMTSLLLLLSMETFMQMIRTHADSFSLSFFFLWKSNWNSHNRNRMIEIQRNSRIEFFYQFFVENFSSKFEKITVQKKGLKIIIFLGCLDRKSIQINQ